MPQLMRVPPEPKRPAFVPTPRPNYATREIDDLGDDFGFNYRVKISNLGAPDVGPRTTKWLTITEAELAAIRAILALRED